MAGEIKQHSTGNAATLTVVDEGYIGTGGAMDTTPLLRHQALATASPSEYPRVSVVIPVYNRPKGCRRAIESVFAQDYQGDIEVVVVEDGSTLPVCDYSGCVYVSLPQNVGVAGARNRGNAVATGSIIVELDSDDVLAVDHAVAKAVSVLVDGADYVYADVGMGEQGDAIWAKPDYKPGMFMGGSLGIGFRAYHYDLWLLLGGHDEKMVAAVDLDFGLRAEEVGAIIMHIPEVLSIYGAPHDEHPRIGLAMAGKQAEEARLAILRSRMRRGL